MDIFKTPGGTLLGNDKIQYGKHYFSVLKSSLY
jgi:hypothetical protein